MIVANDMLIVTSFMLLMPDILWHLKIIHKNNELYCLISFSNKKQKTKNPQLQNCIHDYIISEIFDMLNCYILYTDMPKILISFVLKKRFQVWNNIRYNVHYTE